MRYFYAIIRNIEEKFVCTETLDTFVEKIDENYISVTEEIFQNVLGKQWDGFEWIDNFGIEPSVD